jgi:predicted anti-sigma-YlaC factor YlaD
MSNLLALVSALVWWVLYSSIGALFCTLIAWVVLRWFENGPPVFNRTYLACLLWTLIGTLLVAGVAIHLGNLTPPYTVLLGSNLLHIALVVDMLIGVVLLRRLVPRYDQRRIRPASACVAVATVMAIIFGVATTLGVT